MSSSEKFSSVHELMEEILQIQKESVKNPESIEKVQEIINKSNKLVENSESANEILVDAKILLAGSQVVNSNVSSFDTNLTSFNEEEYIKGIKGYLRRNANGLTNEKNWKSFAPLTYHLFQKSIPTTYMLGLISFEPQPEAKEKVRQERTKKVTSGSKTMLSPSSQSLDKESEVVNENIYEHILKSLVKCYKINDKKPIPFIDFVMNPDSYWLSIENIFYFSFLVRDGRVNMFLSDEGLPVVQPVLKCDSVDGSVKSNDQFSFSLSKAQWRECIKKFKISTPKIKPLYETSNKI